MMRIAPTLGLALLVNVSVAQGDPAEMPLLGDSRLHLYTQQAYEGFDPATEAAVNERYDELVDAGMDTVRHLFDWQDLEPTPGQYDTALVIEAMDAAIERGIKHQFPNLVVIDSAGPVVPQFVEDLLAGGASWDDPQITDAFADLLSVFVPIMLERDMFMLGLSNEPGGYYEDEPELAATFKGFVEAAVEQAHRLEPDLATTVVFAGPNDPAIPDLLPLGDVASFNNYIYFAESDPACQLNGEPLPLFRSDTAENVGRYLDELIAVAQGKLVNIQEIGQAVSGTTLGPNAGEGNQAAVYAALNDALGQRQAQIRTVCNWTLNDHDQAWLSLGQDLVNDGLPQCIADNVVDIFTTTGLVRSDTSATKREAFEQFKAGVSRFAGAPADSAFSINQGIAGAWFDPTRPGQGFLIDVKADPVQPLVFLAWFTFPADATGDSDDLSQRWYTAQGSYEGASAEDLLVSLTTGGRLDSPESVATRPVGTVTLRFQSCTDGEVIYELDEGPSGTIPITRLLTGTDGLCEAL